MLTALPAGFGLAAVAADRLLPAGVVGPAPVHERRGAGRGRRGRADACLSRCWCGWCCWRCSVSGWGSTFRRTTPRSWRRSRHRMAATVGGMLNMARGLGTAVGVAAVTIALHLAAPSGGGADVRAAAGMGVLRGGRAGGGLGGPVRLARPAPCACGCAGGAVNRRAVTGRVRAGGGPGPRRRRRPAGGRRRPSPACATIAGGRVPVRVVGDQPRSWPVSRSSRPPRPSAVPTATGHGDRRRRGDRAGPGRGATVDPHRPRPPLAAIPSRPPSYESDPGDSRLHSQPADRGLAPRPAADPRLRPVHHHRDHRRHGHHRPPAAPPRLPGLGRDRHRDLGGTGGDHRRPPLPPRHRPRAVLRRRP